MVFTRDLDSGEHVYANPVSSFLQHVGKASGRFLFKTVKDIKHRIQVRRSRKKHQPLSFVQLPPRHYGGERPSPEVSVYNYAPVADTSSCQETRKPESTNIYRHLEGNNSYESMAQINPLRRLYVTNPDVPTPRTAADSRSISSSISTTRAKGNIKRPTSLKRTLRPIWPSRPRRPLADIPEESISTEFRSVDLPLSRERTPPRRVHNIDELWFTVSSMDLQGRSRPVFSSPYSSQDRVSTSPASLSSSPAACSLPQKKRIPPTNSRMDVDAPLRSLRSSRGRRLSFRPRIPSLYFRAGSPFADRNLPWNRLNNLESIGP